MSDYEDELATVLIPAEIEEMERPSQNAAEHMACMRLAIKDPSLSHVVCLTVLNRHLTGFW